MSPKEDDLVPHTPLHAAKKAPKKHAPPPPPSGKDDGAGKKKGAGKHLRRCYEHLARVDVLAGNAKADVKLAHTTERARELVLQQLKHASESEEYVKAAAELARATEHIAFAAIVEHAPDRMAWEGPLEEAFLREFGELSGEAEAGAERPDPKAVRDPQEDAQAEIAELIRALSAEAEDSHEAGNYARALECMRGAEALSAAAEHLDQLRKELAV